MPIVLDASVSACWCLPDESSKVAAHALDLLQHDTGLVPAIWWFEMRNIFLSSERQGRITSQQTTKALLLLSQLSIALDYFPDSNTVIKLARSHKLTVYDASYLELALREDLPLATLDHKLAVAANKEKLTLIS